MIDIWGPHTWYLIHTICERINEDYYLNNKNSSEGDLNFFSTLSIVVVSLVTVANNYTSLTNEPTIILPAVIGSLFVFFGLFLHKRIEDKQELTTYMLFIFMPVLIGMGFYVSAISSIIVIFCMKYFLNGVFNFFTDHKEEILDDESDQIIDLDDEDDLIGLDDQIDKDYDLDDGKINGK